MPECKRCGSAQIVKSGTVRGKQRYLCKKCGCHFVEGDQREKSTAAVSKALCTVFQALGAKQYRIIGEYLDRDTSLIYRWMNEKPIDAERRWQGRAKEYESIFRATDDLIDYGVPNLDAVMMADNTVDDLYIAVIVQQRKKQ